MNKSPEVNGSSAPVFRRCASGIFITAGVTYIIQPEKIAVPILLAAFRPIPSFLGLSNLLFLSLGYELFIGDFTLLPGFLNQLPVSFSLIFIPV